MVRSRSPLACLINHYATSSQVVNPTTANSTTSDPANANTKAGDGDAVS